MSTTSPGRCSNTRPSPYPDPSTQPRSLIPTPTPNCPTTQIRDPNAPAAAPASSDGPPKKKANTGDEQVLSLSNERISVPELLFHPSDIGIDQPGVPEVVTQAVETCVPDMREALYSNIVLVGGSTRFPNFATRLETELRSLIPADAKLGVSTYSSPTLAAWRGGSLFAASDGFDSQCVTRQQYHDGGHAYCRKKFEKATVRL